VGIALPDECEPGFAQRVGEESEILWCKGLRVQGRVVMRLDERTAQADGGYAEAEGLDDAPSGAVATARRDDDFDAASVGAVNANMRMAATASSGRGKSLPSVRGNCIHPC